MSDDVRAQRAPLRERLVPGAGLADHVERRIGRGQQAHDARPRHGVVVDHEDPHGIGRPRRRLGDVGLGSGIQARTRVPHPGVDSSSSVPPSSRARSAMPPQPEAVLLPCVVDLGPIEPRAVVLHQERDAGAAA